MRRVTTFSLILTLALHLVVGPRALAATVSLPNSNPTPPVSRTGPMSPSEFVVSEQPGEILLPITVVGAVAKPGIYYVPEGTDFVRLVALSGGVMANALLDEMSIKRKLPSGQYQLIPLEMETVLKDAHTASPRLQANDIVIIPQKQPLLDSNLLLTVSLLSSITGIIMSGVIIFRGR